MRATDSWLALLESTIRLRPAASTPLFRQLHDQIKDAILSGRLQPGARLTSSRTLAHRLGVGRITVTMAYERLAGEGYLESRPGAGTWVAAAPPELGRAHSAVGRSGAGGSVRLPQHVRDLVETAARLPDDGVPGRVEFDFRFMGEPFPMLEWRRMLSRQWTAARPERLRSVPSQGDLALREQIARYLRVARGVRCSAEQVLVISTVGQAVDLVGHLLLERSDVVLVEDPGDDTSRLALQSHGARLVPVAVDADGVDPDAVERPCMPGARLLCLTPSHQYPTGATLSLARRRRLLEWAARTGSLILEDDQSSEYGYDDAVLESMQGLDRNQVVLYVGTFHRLLAGTVRVAYLVVSPGLVPAVTALQEATDAGPPPFVQWALAEFMASGLFLRHQRRLQKIHGRRRDTLLAALAANFGDDVLIGPARAGHHVHVRWRTQPVTEELVAVALRAGVGLRSLRPLYLGAPPADPGAVLAYGGLDELTIERGVARLAEVLSAGR